MTITGYRYKYYTVSQGDMSKYSSWYLEDKGIKLVYLTGI